MIQAPPLNWAQQLSDEREAITAELYRNVPTQARTMIVRVLARSFVEEYVTAVLDGRPPSFDKWAEQMSAKPGRAQAVASLFEAAETLQGYFNERGLPIGFLTGLRIPENQARQRATAEVEQSSYPYNDHMDEVESAIAGLVANLAEVNPKSAEHARAVSSWCTRLARRLGLSESETTFVRRCGMLHDIGDLEVTAETTSMIDHVIAGERIVRTNPHLAEFAPVVRSHHEWLDGSGYPDGKTRGEITLATRIVTVADGFNEAISGAGGRLPMTATAAVDELTVGCGARYDVTIVAALYNLIHEH